MSARSQYHAPNCRRAKETAAKKPHGRLARRLARRDARLAAGDFTFQVRALPAWASTEGEHGFVADKPLRRLYRRVLRTHKTRSSTWYKH